jgi:hypothetical protein
MLTSVSSIHFLTYVCLCSHSTVRSEGDAGFEILDIFLSKVSDVSISVQLTGECRSL